MAAKPVVTRPRLELAVDASDKSAVEAILATGPSAAVLNAPLAGQYPMGELPSAAEKKDMLVAGTALHLAVLRQDERVVRALLDAGADAEAPGSVMLFHGFDWDDGYVREDGWSPEALASNLDFVAMALVIGAHIHSSGGARNPDVVAASAERRHRRRRRRVPGAAMAAGAGDGDEATKLAKKRGRARKGKRAGGVELGPGRPAGGVGAGAGAADEGDEDGDEDGGCDPSSVVYNPSEARRRAPSPVVGPGATGGAGHAWRDIDPSEIALGDAFDSGGFGVVHYGELNGQKVAVKLMPLPLSLVDDAALRRAFLKELQALSAANAASTRVCKLHGASVLGGRLCLVMRLYGGSLADVIDAAPGRRMRTVNVVPALADIALALAEIAAMGLVLRDLKPANCLVDEDEQRVVLADFGLARRVRDAHGRLGTTTNVAGTPNFSAPECFGDEHLTSAVDIWSWAACAVNMFTGSPPFASLTIFQIATRLTVKREHPPIPERAPDKLKALLKRCFAFDPAMRPTAAQLVHGMEEVIAAGGY